jgi:putative transposase
VARLPRYVVPGVPQHVIQRGNNRQAIFADEADYRAYRDWLKESASRHGLRIHAYVLMTNHVHLLVSPEAPDSMGRTLQSLGRRYVQYFNWDLRAHGHPVGGALPGNGGRCRALSSDL